MEDVHLVQTFWFLIVYYSMSKKETYSNVLINDPNVLLSLRLSQSGYSTNWDLNLGGLSCMHVWPVSYFLQGRSKALYVCSQFGTGSLIKNFLLLLSRFTRSNKPDLRTNYQKKPFHVMGAKKIFRDQSKHNLRFHA